MPTPLEERSGTHLPTWLIYSHKLASRLPALPPILGLQCCSLGLVLGFTSLSFNYLFAFKDFALTCSSDFSRLVHGIDLLSWHLGLCWTSLWPGDLNNLRHSTAMTQVCSELAVTAGPFFAEVPEEMGWPGTQGLIARVIHLFLRTLTYKCQKPTLCPKWDVWWGSFHNMRKAEIKLDSEL